MKIKFSVKEGETMARDMKRGLSYFPLDVDFFEDEKIEFISARFGEKGELIAIKLLCSIYRNGYFIEWNEDKATIFAKRAGKNISPSLVNDTVDELIKRGFFEKSIFFSFAILTSRGIQQRYLRASAERKGVEIMAHIWLLDVPKDTKSTKYTLIYPVDGINRPENGVGRPINSQSKGEEIKVNQKTLVHPEGERFPPEAEEPELIEKHFESIWALYPIKRGKQKVSKKAKAALYAISYEELKRAVERYIAEKNRTGYDMANGSTFFNSDYVEFLDVSYQPVPSSQPSQKKSAVPQNRFVNFDQNNWDFDELQKMEEEYIADRLKDGKKPECRGAG